MNHLRKIIFVVLTPIFLFLFFLSSQIKVKTSTYSQNKKQFVFQGTFEKTGIIEFRFKAYGQEILSRPMRFSVKKPSSFASFFS